MRHSIIFLTAIFLTVSSVNSQQEFRQLKDTSDFISKLEISANSINTIKSDFIQEKNLSLLKDKVVTKGKFLFKKNNLLRWEYTSPFSYLIVFRNDKIYIKDENRVTQFDTRSNETFKKINDIMLLGIQGKVLKNKDFNFGYYENEKYFQLRMYPIQKKIKELFSQFNIYFAKKDYSVTKLEMSEPSGDYTKINFKNKKYNEEIPDALFNVK